MHNVIIFGDIHADPACFKIITDIMPDLKKNGYKTIFMEAIPKGIKDIITHIKIAINHLETFPNNEIPEEGKRTLRQKKLFENYQCYKKFPKLAEMRVNDILTFNAGRLVWLKARKAMLEKVIELEMDVKCIDVKRPADYQYAGGTGERSQHMLKEVLKGKKDLKSIIITGFLHVVSTREYDDTKGWKYNRGILGELMRSENIYVDHCFLAYSKVSEQKRTAEENIKISASEIIQKIGIVDTRIDSLPNKLQNLINGVIHLTQKSDEENTNRKST